MVVSQQQIVFQPAIAPEIVAAIAAALAAGMAGESGRRVTGIRPVHWPARWALAGRQELMGGTLFLVERRPAF